MPRKKPLLFLKQKKGKTRQKIFSILGNKCSLCGQIIKPNQRYVVHHIDYYLYELEKQTFHKKIAPSKNIKWIEQHKDKFIILHYICHEYLHQTLDLLFKYKWVNNLEELFVNIKKIIEISTFSENWEIIKNKVLNKTIFK